MVDALNGTNVSDVHSSSKILLEAKELKKKFRIFKNFWFETKVAVDGVSLQVREGEIVGMLGPNGAGKSTTLKMISGDLVPDEGAVYFDGQDVTEWPMYKRCNNGLGYMAQDNTLFKQMTVENNLLGVMQMQGFSYQDAHARSEELMEMFDLTRLRNNIAARLSGGEKQRLTVARALTVRPKMLILDEPFAGMDPQVIQAIQALVVELCHKWGIAILITDHSVPNIIKLVERCYVIAGPKENDKNDLTGGKVIFNGGVDDMINDPAVRASYLGNELGQPTYVGADGKLHVNRGNSEFGTAQTSGMQMSGEPQTEMFSMVSQNVNAHFSDNRAEVSSVPYQNPSGGYSQTENFQSNKIVSDLYDSMESVGSDSDSETLDDYSSEQESEKLATFIPRSNDENINFEQDVTDNMRFAQNESIAPKRKEPPASPTIKPFRRKN